MPVKAGDLEVVANLRDEVSGKVGAIEGKMEKLRGKFIVAGAAITAFSAIAGRDFDAAKTTIVQGTGATGAALDGLLLIFQNLAGTIAGADNQSVAGAVADLNTTFGATGTKLEELVTDTLQAKTAFGEFDIGTFGQAMNLFGLEAEAAGGFLDHLGTAAQETGTPIGELMTQVQTYGPVMKNLGLDAGATATFFGKLHEAGVDVSRVMPGMNQAMRKAAEEGVTDLRGHIEDAMVAIREAKTDTDALRIATETFGAEGAQRMTAAIRTGILPSLSELDSQYENTEGRTKAAYEATLTLRDRLEMVKNKALALVGPVGDAAAGLGAVATSAVLAGPQIVTAAGHLGRLATGSLLGPVGLVAALAAGGLAWQNYRREQKKAEVDIGDLAMKTKDELVVAYQDLETQVEAARIKLEEFRKAEKVDPAMAMAVNDKAAEVEALSIELDRVEGALVAYNVASTGSEDGSGRGGVVGATTEAAGATDEVTRSMAGLITNIEGVQLKFGQLTAEDFPNLIQTIADIPNQRDWKITGEEIGGPLMVGLSGAVEEGAPEVVSTAESFSDDIATALLNGQSVSEALESAFKANIVKNIAKESGDFIGGIIGKAAGPKIAGLIAGPIGGALAGLASSFLSKIMGALAAAFSRGGAAGKAREKGATKFRMTADGIQYYINGEWVDEGGNPVGSGGGSGGGGGVTTPKPWYQGTSYDPNPANRPGSGGGATRTGPITPLTDVPNIPALGMGGPTPPDQHIHINIDGQEVASVVARRLPGVADEEGW